jgi:hypothetical protein
MLGEIPKAVQEYGSIDFNFMFVNPLARSRELEGVKSLQSAALLALSLPLWTGKGLERLGHDKH